MSVARKGKDPVKIIIGAIVLVVTFVAGSHQKPMCMDPNTNTPIDCSLLK